MQSIFRLGVDMNSFHDGRPRALRAEFTCRPSSANDIILLIAGRNTFHHNLKLSRN